MAASSEPLRTIILVGIYSGLRIEPEALTLRWKNVDFKRRELTVEAAYSKNNETQAIPMNSKLLEALKLHEAKRTGDYLFLNRYGRPFRSVRTAFTTACRHANLPGVTPHT
jgi:integrase